MCIYILYIYNYKYKCRIGRFKYLIHNGSWLKGKWAPMGLERMQRRLPLILLSTMFLKIKASKI